MACLTWHLPTRDPDAERALAQELGVSTTLASLLRNRGLGDTGPARSFLRPRLADVEDPSCLADLDRGAERLARAIRDRERILIYGDYDVDGMVGTVVLMNFIRLAGSRCDFYIPDRVREGYSFSEEAVRQFTTEAEPPQVVLTVDHGTSSEQGIAALARKGIDVVVTDHHEPPEHLPEAAYALINPRRRDCPSRFKSLCGAAVAFKLVWGTARHLSGRTRVDQTFRDYLLEAMGMVAMATVTDVVPLQEENRVFCHHGLRALAVSKSPGLRALLDRSRLQGRTVRAVHVGYRLGPRLNAAGRMGIPEVAIELLTTQDENRARRLAARLEDANDQRRLLEREMLNDCLAREEVRSADGRAGLCLGSSQWHPGVIGIVAARLVDRLQVPVLLVALNGQRGRGSARAPEGLHLRDLLAECQEHLAAFGGHAGAAGCTVSESAFEALSRDFVAGSERLLARRSQGPVLHVDLEFPFRMVRPELVAELELLAPHGMANPPALFATRGIEIAGRPRQMGRDRSHLAFYARHGDRTLRAIAFGMGAWADRLSRPGVRLDLCYRLKFDTYRDPGSVELEVQDLRPA